MGTEQGTEHASTASDGNGWTTNRRQVLRAASGLMAAAAIGGVALQAGPEHVAAAPAAGSNSAPMWVEIPELTVSGAAGRTVTGFEALSFQFGVGRGVSSPSGGGDRETSAPSLSEVVITKHWDAFTPLLMGEATYGDALSSVTFTFSDHQGTTVGTIKLSDVLVSGESVSYGGDLSAASESVSFNFVEIEVNFRGQHYQWNLATGSSS